MKLRIFLTVLVALAAFAGIFGFKIYKNRQAQAALAARKPVPSTIITAVALAEKWRNTLHAVGTLQSFQGITVRSEIEGRITKVAFESGARVKAGDVLLEMDTAAEVAQLASSEASAKLSNANLERARELQKNNSNTKAELEAAEAGAAQATAQIENIKSTLAKKRIVAPFDGRVGIRLVNLGQFLNKADAVVTLEAIDTMYADFSLPQQDISALKPGLTVNVNVDAFPGRVFEGKIEAIDPRINETTRNVRVRAVLPNKDEALRAGMFARVDVVLPEERDLVVLPATAIVYSPYGDSVYVVVQDKEKNAQVAQQRFVTVGPKRGDLVSLTKGVQAGEEVVTGGQGKLRPGSLVKVNNTVVPANSATPKPSES